MYFTDIGKGVFSGTFSKFNGATLQYLQAFVIDYPSPYYLEVDALVMPIRANGGFFTVNTAYGLPPLTPIDRIGLQFGFLQANISLNPNWDLTSLTSSYIVPTSIDITDARYKLEDTELVMTWQPFEFISECDGMLFTYTV